MAIPAFAGYEIFLAVDNVAGTPADIKHTDWISVTEIQDNTIKTAGTISLVITKPIDGRSAALYRSCLSGMRHPHATMDVCKDGVLMYRTSMDDITISQIRPEFTKKDTDPKEEISFNFKTINWEFYTTGADGKPATTRGGWDNVLKRAM
mgnify:FL=1